MVLEDAHEVVERLGVVVGLEPLDESAAEDMKKIAEKTELSEKIAKYRGKEC